MGTDLQDMSFCRVDDLSQVHKVFFAKRNAGMSNLKKDMPLRADARCNAGVIGEDLRKLIL